MSRIYLDNAATTPLDKEVIQAMLPFMEQHFGNPSSIHAEGRKAKTAIEEARKTIAKHLNCSIGEIFFTSCGTEANNLAIKGAVKDLEIQRIITSEIEHHCNLHSYDYVKKNFDTEIVYVPLYGDGSINYDILEDLLKSSDKKTMVSLMFANNEIGNLLDINRVSKLCETYHALLHSDTVQAIGHYAIDLTKTKLHFLAGSAHKFHGPKGVGFIYLNNEVRLQPLLDGGSQERNMRGGTENVIGIVGLAKAMDLACREMEQRSSYIQSLKDYLKTQLLSTFEDIQFNGNQEHNLYTVLSVSFPPNAKSETLLMNFDIAGIAVSGGSACNSGAETASHVVSKLDKDPNRRTIRFSFSHFNTKEELNKVIEVLKPIYG